MKFLFFLFPICLFGSVCVPFTMDLKTGYRQDHIRIKTVLPGENLAREKYKNVRFYQTDLTMRTIQRDIYLLLNGGYGALGKGEAFVNPYPLDFTSVPTSFALCTEGNSYHVKGIFGYGVNLTPERYYRVVLTPLVGYGAIWQYLKRKDPSPNPFTASNAPGQTNTFSLSINESDDNLYTSWRGFIVGGNLWITPGGPFSLRLDYGYHFMKVYQNLFQEQSILRYDGNDSLTNREILTYKTRVRKNGAHGHSGSFEIIYLLTEHLNLSLEGGAFYYFSTTQSVDVKKNSQIFFPTVSQGNLELDSRYNCTHLMLSALFVISWSF